MILLLLEHCCVFHRALIEAKSMKNNPFCAICYKSKQQNIFAIHIDPAFVYSSRMNYSLYCLLKSSASRKFSTVTNYGLYAKIYGVGYFYFPPH